MPRPHSPSNKSPDPPPSLVDFQRLEEVCMGDVEAMIDLVDFFFSQASEEMARLDKAIADANSEAVRHCAHRLLGSSAGCGLTGMVPPCAELERRSLQGDLSTAGPLFASLREAMNQTQMEFERWRSGTSAR